MRTRWFFVAFALAIAGCSGSPSQTVFANNAPTMIRARASSPIQHVIVMVQGHRGFNNLFAGFPGAETSKAGGTHTGKKVRLTPMPESEHASTAPLLNGFEIAYDNGKMDGFDLVYPKDPLFPYHFVEHSEISAYWSLAKQFALADHMFSTSISNSGFVAQLYLLAARSEVKNGVYVADHPSGTQWGCNAPPGTTTPVYTPHGIRRHGPFPCFSWYALAQLLDNAGVSWRYYLPSDELALNAVGAIAYIQNSRDWQNVTTPQTAILNDIQNGNLPDVTWVYPDQRNSDDPGTGSGSKWVSTVVGALRKSRYWQSSAVIVVWESSDFFYDEVPPPRLAPVELGFRVPMLIVSPFAKKGYVSHTQYEFGSILKFIESQYALPSLGQTDARANSIGDVFTFPERRR